MIGADDPFEGVHRELAALRADDRRRTVVMLAGLGAGLGLGSLHWGGLVLGGALVALPARSFRRGLVHGLSLGVIGLVAFGLLLASRGALLPALGTGTVVVVTVVVGLAAPLLGSLARGLA